MKDYSKVLVDLVDRMDDMYVLEYKKVLSRLLRGRGISYSDKELDDFMGEVRDVCDDLRVYVLDFLDCDSEKMIGDFNVWVSVYRKMKE